jgi:hypothetical protein
MRESLKDDLVWTEGRERKKSHTKYEASCERRKVRQRLENWDKENSHTKHNSVH